MTVRLYLSRAHFSPKQEPHEMPVTVTIGIEIYLNTYLRITSRRDKPWHARIWRSRDPLLHAYPGALPWRWNRAQRSPSAPTRARQQIRIHRDHQPISACLSRSASWRRSVKAQSF